MVTIEKDNKRFDTKKHLVDTYTPIKMQPKPDPSPPDIKKYIIVILAIIILGGFVWKFYPGLILSINDTSQPISTPAVTDTPVPMATLVTEALPTGKEISIYVHSRRGFIPHNQPDISADMFEIRPGDKVVWFNDGKDTVTLVSDISDFGTKVLDYYDREEYIFKKPGTYYFYFEENRNFESTITVKPE